ncbi:MAG: hypothetical protein JW751_08615 [Polyangiaceae bacterium]|nr:hypothetical protein [Polyangiaceae bacterium]
MTDAAELRRAARVAESECRFARAARLRHKADCLDAATQGDPEERETLPPAGDPLDMSGLSTAELIRVVEDCFNVGAAAAAELSRREGA